MNQLYRALAHAARTAAAQTHGRKGNLYHRRAAGAHGGGADPLPALGGAPYTQLPGREGFWYADPLLYRRNGARYLFAEAMDLAAGKGRIEVCHLLDNGTTEGWQVALEEDFHLSFPTVFDWNGETWMIPNRAMTTACGSTAARTSPPSGNWCSGSGTRGNCAMPSWWTAPPTP